MRKGGGDINLVSMDSPDIIHDRFFGLLIKNKEEYGRGFNKFLHHETGLSTSYLSLLIGGKKRASQETQAKIANALKIDYQTILTPEASMRQISQPENVLKYQTETEKKHFKVIQSFDDPDIALKFNSALTELEKLSVADYLHFFADVKGRVEALKKEAAEKKAAKAKAKTQDNTPKKAFNGPG